MIHPHMIQHLALAVNPLGLSPFEWANNHIHMIAWPTICIIAWKAGNVWRKFLNTAEKTIGQVDTMATNHFPHMEESLAKQDGYLKGISEDMHTLASKWQ